VGHPPTTYLEAALGDGVRRGIGIELSAPEPSPVSALPAPAPPLPAPGGGRFGGVGIALLALVAVVWGAAYVFIRQGIELGASPLVFAATRYALSAGAFAALALARREPRPDRGRLVVSAALGGTLIIGIYGGLLYWGEQFSTGGYAAVLASTAPLWTVLFGFSILASERLGPRGLLGIGVGFAGTAVLVVPELSGSALGGWEGPVFVLGAMLSAAAGTVLLRRFGGGRQGLWQIGAQFGAAGLLLGAVAAILPVPERLPLDPGVLGALAFLVVFSSVVGYFGYFALHHRVGPVRANVVAYLAPLVGVGVGSGLFGEPVTVFEIVGVAIVLIGVTFVLRESGRSAPAPPRPGVPTGR
jgi:drug/metabolite transporter (DMT)-like permease